MVGLRQPGSAVVSCDLGTLAGRAGTRVAALDAIAYRPAARLGHNVFWAAWSTASSSTSAAVGPARAA